MEATLSLIAFSFSTKYALAVDSYLKFLFFLDVFIFKYLTSPQPCFRNCEQKSVWGPQSATSAFPRQQDTQIILTMHTSKRQQLLQCFLPLKILATNFAIKVLFSRQQYTTISIPVEPVWTRIFNSCNC